MYLEDADASLLLVCLFQQTQDLSMIEQFEKELKANGWKPPAADGPMSGVAHPPPLGEGLRSKVIEEWVRILTAEPASGHDDLLTSFDEPVRTRLAEALNGGPIDPSFLRFIFEQSGLMPDVLEIPRHRLPDPHFKLVIIGAGMSGIAAAVMALQRGFTFEVLESSDGIGGVWHLNRYPGVGVDTPALTYSLSFRQSMKWSNFYPLGTEYKQYLLDVANHYRLEQHIKTGHHVESMTWEEDRQQWRLQVRHTGGASEIQYADAVMTALGHLNRPNYPNLPGRDTFSGVQFHANRWRSDVDLSGKRVAVIGAGPTAVQVVSSLQDQLKHLTVFQRQPHWIYPNAVGDGNVPPGRRWLWENIPGYVKWYRLRFIWRCDDNMLYDTHRVDREWAATHLSVSKSNDQALQILRTYLNDCFADKPELARKLTPEYAPNAKRPVRDPGDFGPGGYYYALTRDHVDLELRHPAEVVPQGIRLDDGQLLDFDVIIYATGLTLDYVSTIDITGREGRTLTSTWGDRPHSYLGGMVPGFPNLFINSCPNTGVGHGLVGHNFMAEVVNHFAFECLQSVVNEDAAAIEVRKEADDAWDKLVVSTMEGSIWRYDFGAHSYYRNSLGDVVLPTPFRHVDYWQYCRGSGPENFILSKRERSLEARRDPASRHRSVVLGGGGAVGLAWEIGLLAGLVEGGLQVTEADTVIGTSAGAFAGAALTGDQGVKAAYIRLMESQPAEIPAQFDQDLQSAYQEAYTGAQEDPQKTTLKLGRLARSKTPAVEREARCGVVKARLATDKWPSNLNMTALDADSGKLCILKHDSGLTLQQAAAASGAVPGVWPVEQTDGHSYIDGGMISTTNVHLAAQYDVLLVIAPISTNLGGLPGIHAECAQIKSRSHVALITPDAASLEEFGPNLFDPSRRAAAALAGYKQARAEAEKVLYAWEPQSSRGGGTNGHL